MDHSSTDHTISPQHRMAALTSEVSMPVEIERKFRVASDRWRGGVTATRRLRQGYLANSENASIRIRIIDGSNATLTIKTVRAGVSREEFEYAVPVEDAEALMRLCPGVIIAKVRHIVPAGDLAWEIDVFEAENEGLVIAEIELDHPDQAFARPSWLGEEVTHDQRFYNAELTRHPFTRW